jgi:hypothetical protein
VLAKLDPCLVLTPSHRLSQLQSRGVTEYVMFSKVYGGDCFAYCNVFFALNYQ